MNQELTQDEAQVKNILEEVFVPALHHVLKTAAPEKYEKWSHNCCRQTAIFGTMLLKALLFDYEITPYEAVFEDIEDGREVTYEHAWIFAKKNGRRLLIDMARNNREKLFVVVSSNGYPKDHPQYKDMKEISRKPLDFKHHMRETEFYTKKPSLDVLEMIIKRMSEISKDFNNMFAIFMLKRMFGG
jgi:hypothetical protein